MDSSRSLPVIPCPLADRDQARAHRYYAHTFHRSGVICVARAFYTLPLEHYWAILAHEVGHLLAGEDGTEEDADSFAEEAFNITIYYSSTKHGQELQTVTTEDAMTISQFPFILNYDPVPL